MVGVKISNTYNDVVFYVLFLTSRVGLVQWVNLVRTVWTDVKVFQE